MSDELYTQVDEHLEGLFGPPDEALTGALARMEEAGIPAINVSPAIGRFLHVLALARGARRILEIGTLGGYSTIWLGRALPDGGRLVTLEVEPRHAEVARTNLAAAGLDEAVEVRVGRALDLLEDMARDVEEPFDLVFIDADKPPYAEYLQASIRLSRRGTVIVADNIVRRGAVAQGPSDDPAVTGVQRFTEAAARHPGVEASFLQVVGVKGHDGLAVVTVTDPTATG